MTTTKTHPIAKFIGVILLAACVYAFFIDKRESAHTGAKPLVSESVAAVAKQEVVHMKPEALVRFPDSSIACLTKNGLMKVSDHLIKGEKTKAKAYFMQAKSDKSECIMIDPNATFKVLSAEYNNSEIPDLGIMEIVGLDAKSSDGAWVFTVGAVTRE
jgi:hypothetical protein